MALVAFRGAGVNVDAEPYGGVAVGANHELGRLGGLRAEQRHELRLALTIAARLFFCYYTNRLQDRR